MEWNNTIRIKDLFQELNEEDLTVTKLQSIATEISKRLNSFIEEQKDHIGEIHWLNVLYEFEQLGKDSEINADQFDGVLDNLYDLADDDKVWIE